MTLRPSRYPVDDGIPIAIIWRPVSYYSCRVVEAADDFDAFSAACFNFGNTPLDMRRYAGHPEKISSLYVSDYTEIGALQNFAMDIFTLLGIQKYSVGWVYGNTYTDGVLERNAEDQIREKELGFICLKICYLNKGHASLSFIREVIERTYPLSPRDLTPAFDRGSEPRWWEILRNIHKHRSSKNNILRRKYATYENQTFTLTELGLNYLANFGFDYRENVLEMQKELNINRFKLFE